MKKTVTNEWFIYAQMDYNSADYLQNMYPMPIEIICYHCQQCAEKLLKGFLYFCEQKIPKTHDLMFLLSKCIELDSGSNAIKIECLALADFGVNTRYPFHLELQKEDVYKALSSAKRIIDYFENKI